ncbi:glycosyl transferase group 1 [Botrytis cinerea]
MLESLLTLATIISTIFTITLLLIPKRYIKHSPPMATQNGANAEPKISVQVLVLGDIGRSPRMQYHAMSIAKHGGRVDLIGYEESELPSGLTDNPLITIVPLPLPPSNLRDGTLPFFFAGPCKVLWQIWTLFIVLCYTTKAARWLLVQNPPSIPTFFVAYLVCLIRNTHLIIDWHNYGWTILAGTRGPKHIFVRLYKWYEAFLGSWAPTASFTVSKAMERQLRESPYKIKSPIFTLHDRPASIFQPITDEEKRRAFLQRLPETKDHVDAIMNGDIRLLVSSTSWTPDEDFNLLLDALVKYGPFAEFDCPPILAIITGKGPQKQMYLDRIAELTESYDLVNVTIKTAWLSIEDYASLLACADLGVCLHKSSSGVDLPMKVVDMFGAGLPVVGYDQYFSWPELVKEGINGWGFTTAKDLAEILEEVFKDTSGKELARLKKGAIEEGRKRWDEEWDGVAGRLLGLID